jgi:hypothetical protein
MSLIWTDATLEPKRKFKYVVTFTGTELADFQFLAQTCDRPGVKVGATEHKYFDKTYYHPGRVTWDPNPLSIKLVDIQKKGANTTIDTNEKLLKVFAGSGLSGLISNAGTPSGTVQTISKAKATSNSALGTVHIRVINADSSVAEEWELKNSWLESFKPDALDYGSEDILTVTIQVRYDWAQFKAQGAGTTINGFGPGGAPPVGNPPPTP